MVKYLLEVDSQVYVCASLLKDDDREIALKTIITTG